MRLLLLILTFLLFASPSARAQVRLLDNLIYHLDDDRSAAEEIRKIGRDAVPALLDAFARYKFSRVRDEVTTLLGEIAPDDPKVRSTLLKALEDKEEDTTVRSNAARGLARLASKDATVLRALTRVLLEDDEDNVRCGVVVAFRDLREKPKAAMPALIKALRDKDGLIRMQVAWTLAESPHTEGTGLAILNAFRGFKDGIAWGISNPGTFHSGMAEALGQFAPEIVPALVKALSDDDAMVRRGAVLALGYAKPRTATVVETVTAMVKLLKDKDRMVRYDACDSLGQMHKDAAAAAPALVESLKDEEVSVRCHAGWALGAIGPAAASAVPELIKALKDKRQGDSRYAAASALGEIGPAAKAAVPALTQARSEDAEMDRVAGWSLQKILNPPRAPTAFEQIECWLKLKLGISVNLSKASKP
jgi:HEAT repeat protein